MSLMMIVGFSIVSLLTQPLAETLSGSKFYLGFGVAYAWLALGVMTSAWVSNKQLAWHWPVLGGIAGVLCSAYASGQVILIHAEAAARMVST